MSDLNSMDAFCAEQREKTVASLAAELARCNASLETAVGANAMWKRLHDEAQAELARCRELLRYVEINYIDSHDRGAVAMQVRAALAGGKP